MPPPPRARVGIPPGPGAPCALRPPPRSPRSAKGRAHGAQQAPSSVLPPGAASGTTPPRGLVTSSFGQSRAPPNWPTRVPEHRRRECREPTAQRLAGPSPRAEARGARGPRVAGLKSVSSTLKSPAHVRSSGHNRVAAQESFAPRERGRGRSPSEVQSTHSGSGAARQSSAQHPRGPGGGATRKAPCPPPPSAGLRLTSPRASRHSAIAAAAPQRRRVGWCCPASVTGEPLSLGERGAARQARRPPGCGGPTRSTGRRGAAAGARA